MSTIERLDQMIETAERLGYRIRYDYFGGTGGGVCEIAGTKWMFMDLALNSVEQLEQLETALADEPLLQSAQPSPPKDRAANSRHAA